MPRQKYYFFDDDDNKILAAGLLPYRFNKKINNYEFLMIKYLKNNVPFYSDFGGCVDKNDTDINTTIARETDEESNGVLSFDNVYGNLHNGLYLLNLKSRYLVVFCSIKYITKKKIEGYMFGDVELHDNIERTIEWISLDKLTNNEFKNHLNFRLRFKDFFVELYNKKKKLENK